MNTLSEKKQFITEKLKELGLFPSLATINADYSVDYNGHIDIRGLELKEIPVKFGVVNGDFICADTQLVTLKNSPHTVKGDFYCSKNYLTNLQHGPTNVGGAYFCKENKLNSLLGCPKAINGTFDCSLNELTTLENCPQTIKSDFNCANNKINTLSYFPEHVGNTAFIEYNVIQDIQELKKCKIAIGLRIGGLPRPEIVDNIKIENALRKYYNSEKLNEKFKKDEIISLKNGLENSLSESKVDSKRKMKL